jgi:hypothetical protein
VASVGSNSGGGTGRRRIVGVVKKLLTANAAANRLREQGVPLTAGRLRQLDDELHPLRVDDGHDGMRVYREDAIDAFAARRKDDR